MANARTVITSRFRSLEEWGEWINSHAEPDSEPNRPVLMGSGGRPATREELENYLLEHKARMERESGSEPRVE